MPLEQYRKRLMSQNVDWGAPPPNGHMPSATMPPKSGTTSSLEVAVEPLPGATTAAGMEYVDAKQIYSKIVVSSKDWDVDRLVERGPRFKKVPRVSPSSSRFYSAIEDHERFGTPLIIEGWHKHSKWPKELFTIDWFREHGQQDAKARNVHDWTDRDISIQELIDKQRAIATYVLPGETERLYGKDAHCPEAWIKWLNEDGILPAYLRPEGSKNLLQCLPEAERVETLMCYLGIGDTFTPCHKDLCASTGQNLMCYTENSGSSFWFMTESSSAPAVADYFHELGQELDLETHVITIEELEKAPFTVYIAEQKLGDMVLVPPRSCHQVVNHGGITIKTSWSRMTLDGLITAFYHELPIYRRVCRTETYRVKYTIYHTLLYYAQELQKYSPLTPSSSSHDFRVPVSSSCDELLPPSDSDLQNKAYLAEELRRLISLFDDVLVEEFCQDHKQIPHMTASSSTIASSDELSSFTPPTHGGASRITCDFCDTDVYQSFFECRKCVTSSALNTKDPGSTSDVGDDGLVICPSCYVEGRTCQCEDMRPMQCRPFEDLLRDRNRAMKVLEQSEMETDQSHQHIVLTEGNMLLRRLSIFEAACALHRYYESQRQVRHHERNTTRNCTRKREPHPVSTSQLPCKRCRCSVCFDHILELGVHSAEAILVYEADPSHDRWHERHKDMSLFTQALPRALLAEKDGVRCDVNHKMVITAKKFNVCMPSNLALTKPGWYDKVIQSPNIPTEDSDKRDKHAIEETMDDPVIFSITKSPPSALSSLTASPNSVNSPLPDVNEETSSSSDEDKTSFLSLGNNYLSVRPVIPPDMSNFVASPAKSHQDTSGVDTQLADSPPAPRKRKRQVLDYILIPSVPQPVVASIAHSKTRRFSMSQTTGNAKQKETNERLLAEIEMASSSHNPVPFGVLTDMSLSADHPMRAPSSKRVVFSSRESTPDLRGPPNNKKARFRKSFPSQYEDEIEVPSRKRKADTLATTSTPMGKRPDVTSTSTACASAPDALVEPSDHMRINGLPGRPPASVDGALEEAPSRMVDHNSVDKPLRSFGAAGSTLTSSLPIHPGRFVRNLEKKLEFANKRADLADERRVATEKQMVKQIKAQDRRIHKLEELVDALRDQYQRSSARQEDYNTNHRLKIQREISSIREETAQLIGRQEKTISDVRTDLGELRTRIAEKGPTSGSSPAQTHIVLAESIRVINPDAMHINGGQQHGYASRGHPSSWNNNLPSQWFHTQSDHLEVNTGQQHLPGSNRISREDGARGNNNGRYPPGYKSQKYSHNKHTFDAFNSFFPDQLTQPNQHQRVPMAGPSRQAYARSKHGGPPKMNRWGQLRSRPVSGANSIDILPIEANRDNREVRENVKQTHVVDGIRAPECSLSPTRIATEAQVRPRSPSVHWEDTYEQHEEAAPTLRGHFLSDTGAPIELVSVLTRTPSDALGDSVEENPWAQ